MYEKLLSNILSSRMVVVDPEVLARFAVDGIAPKVVIYPNDLGQVAEVIKLANTEKWSIVPWGSGSRMALGRIPSRVDVALSTSRLDKIVDIDVANLTVTAQAGVKLRDLQDLLAGTENRCFFPLETDFEKQADYMCSSRDYKGAFLPLDPPFFDRATLGGVVASNATGPKRLRYGLPRDLILGVRFVSPTGGIIGMGGKTVKNVSGYDVTKIMIGSLGSLGVLGDMTCRLLPLPEQVGTMLVSFSTLVEAKAFADRVLNSKLLPVSVEVLNAPAFDSAAFKDFSVLPGSWVVAIGLEGFDEEVQREISDLKEMAGMEGALDLFNLDRTMAASFWSNLGDNVPREPDKTAVRFKGAFLISQYGDVLEAWSGLSGGNCPLTASAGLGLAYAHLTCGSDVNFEEAAKLGASFRSVAERCGGSMVVESAPPELKKQLDPWGSTRNDFILMRRVKDNLDPLGVLNPGRFLGGL